METGSGHMPSVVRADPETVSMPSLLVELPPWHKVFLRNLADLLQRRRAPVLHLASKPGDFWPDVFVRQRLPWRRFLESYLYHAVALLVILYASLLLPHHVQIAEHHALNHEDVIYYRASDYLPPLDTGDPLPKQAAKGDPVYAPQPILSVPPEADNRRQTIVTPPKLRLDHDVPLPNVVAWPKAAPQVPFAATQPAALTAKTPLLDMQVVAPAPDVKLASSRQKLDNLADSAVAPTPDVDANSIRRVGDLNIGHSQVVAPAPQLAVAEQRMAAGRTGLGNSATAVPPPPTVSGSGGGNSSGRLIALSIHPEVAAPADPPAGNRRGSFAAGPQGKANATGTPEISGEGRGSGTRGGGEHSDIPPGLHVGAGPDPKSSPVGGNGGGSGNGNGEAATPSKSPALMAKATPPRVSSRPLTEASPRSESEEDKEIFGERKF